METSLNMADEGASGGTTGGGSGVGSNGGATAGAGGGMLEASSMGFPSKPLRNAYLAVMKGASTMHEWMSTWSCRLAAALAGVEIGRNVRFHGRAHFFRSSTGILRIGDGCVFRSSATSNLIGINRPCMLSSHAGAELIIGAGCGFSGSVIGCFKRIVIEDHVRCGANTMITDGDWHADDPRSSAPNEVRLCKNVWLGEGVRVLKGVTIGENTVIGAGSVVTRDIPANVIAAGNPCSVIRKLDT